VAAGERGNTGSRSAASIVLTVLGCVLLFAGVLLFYARDQIVDADSFADKSEAALEKDAVRDVVTREIVVGLIDRGSTDLVAGRPVLESVVGTVVDTSAFRKLFRRAAIEANRLFFVREKENFVFDLADASEIVRFGLKSVSPELAKQVPKDIDVSLLDLKNREFARATLDAADSVRLLGIIVPLLAIVLLAGGVALATDRRVGVLRAAVGVASTGVVLAVALLILREVTLNGVYGSDELSDEDVRGAVGGIFDAFLGPLLGWGLLMAFTGIVVAAAATSLSPEGVQSPVQNLRDRFFTRPERTWVRALRGACFVLAGFLVAFDPDTALKVIALLVGAYLVFYGASELLELLQAPGGDSATAVGGRRRTFAIAAAAGLVVAAAIAITLTLVLDSAEDPDAKPLPTAGCNGSPGLCKLHLNQVAFAGTHNSFSAADSPGWLIANQRRNIERQLADGIRLFLLDPHWGVQGEDGRVRTDFEAEQRDRNRIAKALPPNVLAAAERLTGRLGLRDNEPGQREIWLCHSTCELGATSMAETLGVFREFLERNPGEVAVLFLEPYVDPTSIEQAFKDADLDRYLETLDRSAPMPTLGQLVRRDKRLIVFTERDGGDPAWYMDGFSFIQDTPLGVTKVDQLSCELNRGSADSPILMLNHWADVFPPKRSANEPFQTRRELLDRARRCARARGRPTGFIAVDHYDLGELIGAVKQINDERVARLGSN
jgi:hypothetical protein